MNFVSWIVLGLLAGSIAKIIVPNNSVVITLGNFLGGFIGAVGGGVFAMLYTTGHLALMATHISIFGVILALLGAIVAVFAYQAIIQTNF